MFVLLTSILKEVFKSMDQRVKEIEETYLAAAEDIHDLERRQRQVARGMFRAESS